MVRRAMGVVLITSLVISIAASSSAVANFDSTPGVAN
jgi:hypothetical protein